MFNFTAKETICRLFRFISFLKEIKQLKIDAAEEDKNTGLLYLLVSFHLKSTPPMKKDPYQLLTENGEKISTCFSKDDFKKIIDAMLENQKRKLQKKYSKTYTYVKHQLTESGEPILVYKDIHTGQFFMKNIVEIYYDKKLINQFSSEDSACIGNIVGAHILEMEFKQKSELINSSEHDLTTY